MCRKHQPDRLATGIGPTAGHASSRMELIAVLRKIKIADVCIVLALALLVIAIAGIVATPDAKDARQADTNGDGVITLSDYAGKRIGTITGVNYDKIIDRCIPGSQIYYYSSYPDLVVALNAGLLDAFIVDEPALAVIMREDPGIGKVPEDMETWQMTFVFSDEEKSQILLSQMNSFVRMLKETDELQKIQDVWLGTDESLQTIPPLDALTGESGTVRVALETTYAPIVYIKDQQIVGYEIDILYRFCEAYHYGLELMDMQFDAVLPSLLAGKCDIGASGMEYSDEHGESVSMSEPHIVAATSLACPASDLGINVDKEAETEESLWDRIASSFEKNFVREKRWHLVVEGIRTTCVITLLAMLFGTLFAFLICMLRRTDSRLANPLCNVLTHIVQGTPLVVLLMILYYVVFSGASLDGLWVSVIGFSLCFGINTSVIMQSGLDSIDRGQEEAALALGYTKMQAFFRFLFPQAAVRFLPVYRGEAVALLNDTSIVGYIAVQDLTMMSDIIRSRSYEAFLPLIVSTLIYFLLARILTIAVDLLLKRIRPKKKSKVTGGEKA